MAISTEHPDLEQAAQDAAAVFARCDRDCGVEYRLEQIGTETFLKFVVGRELPLYDHALRVTQKTLPPESPFRGLLGLTFQHERVFPCSLEADVLQTIITRETRRVGAEGNGRSPLAGEHLLPESGGLEGHSAGHAPDSGTAGGREVDADSAGSGTPGEGEDDLCCDGHAGLF